MAKNFYFRVFIQHTISREYFCAIIIYVSNIPAWHRDCKLARCFHRRFGLKSYNQIGEFVSNYFGRAEKGDIFTKDGLGLEARDAVCTLDK